MSPVGLIWAQSTSGVIGRDNGIPWRLPEDQARFKEISPFMSRITGKEAPPAWTADMMPAFEQAKTRVAMLTDPASASGVQSTYVDDQGNRIAIMRDGSTQVLGRNNASIRGGLPRLCTRATVSWPR